MIDQGDATRYVRAALNLLLMKNPFRTSMGILAGVIAGFLAELFRPSLSALEWMNVDIIARYWPGCIVGAFCFNVPVFVKRHSLNEEIEEKLSAIRRCVREGKLSAAQAKTLYLRVAMDVIEGTKLRPELEQQVGLSRERP
jgi:hypothetical protein